MPHTPPEHEVITGQSTTHIYNNGKPMKLVVEYRADGCVTWREQ
jgi:hypothetical protein